MQNNQLMICKIISSESHGNAVLYENVLVDCGVGYKKLAPYLDSIKLILLTHIHSDHFNRSTIRRIRKEYPLMRFGCGEWLYEDLVKLGVKNIDVMSIGKLYDYKIVKVAPVMLYHDVPNCGWRIFINETKIFHATDTHTLRGITAKNYDIYAIEHNYDELFMEYVLSTSKGYEHGHRSKQTHLSIQQAEEFIEANKKPDSKVLKLHVSTRYGGVEN